ncbi:MAG: hypothetical protein JSU72_15765 [Deltaproteobacteria bacterium]|nr:MAG: hypothetical protein JSU72_15765 [Deltaproteobacteria bacterium]
MHRNTKSPMPPKHLWLAWDIENDMPMFDPVSGCPIVGMTSGAVKSYAYDHMITGNQYRLVIYEVQPEEIEESEPGS